MKKIYSALFFSIALCLLGFSQTTINATVDFNGAQANGCCTVCGNDYWCINNVGGCGTPSGCDSRTFFDPVPAGNIVTNIQIDYWTADCYGNYITGSINGVSAPTVNENNTGCWCSNNPCGVSVSSTVNYPCGFPNYVYGGTNTLQLCTGADVCVDRVILKITYYTPSQINPSITAQGPTNFCQGGSVVLDAGAGYSAYSWNTGANTQTINVSTSGTYIVTVTSLSGCTSGSASINVNVFANPSPVITSSGPLNFCQGGSISLDAGAGYSNYSWTTGANTQIISVSASGTYGVTVTDANGCVGSTTINVTAYPSPSVTATSTVAGCSVNNGTATANPSGGTPGYTYLWSNGDPNQTANNLAAGTYVVTVTDANGCTAQTSVVVNGTNAPTVSATSTQAGCSVANGTATANPSGGTPSYTYLWNDGQITQTAVGLAPGTYTVTVTDANGCVAITSITITGTAAPTLTASATAAGCSVANGTASATASGGNPGYTYLWSNGDTSQNATGLAGGTYTVSVTDANGCSSSTTVNVSTTSSPTTTSAALSNVSCNGGSNGSIVTNPSGGTSPYTFLWNIGQTTQTASGLPAGTYTVVITDANGCTAVDSVSVSQPTVIALSTTQNNLICNGANGPNNGNATVNASGGTPVYFYQWSNGQVTQTATGLSAGTYVITVTDANGCTSFTSVTITQPPAIGTFISQTSISCNGGNNGTATATISGGTSPYTYLWTPPMQNGQTATGLSAGNYTVNITDANGCTATTSLTVTQPPLLNANTAPANPLCNGGSNGTATVNMTNGTAPYTYLWSNSQTGQTATGLTAGNYSVFITDANGCTTISSTSLTEPPAITLSSSGSADSVCMLDSIVLNSFITGGTSPYTYVWQPGPLSGSSVIVTPTATTSYTLFVTDANGCTASASAAVTVFVFPAPIAFFDTASNGMFSSVFSFSDLSTGSISWFWDFGDGSTSTQQNPVHSFPGSGTYTVTQVVFNQYGCPDTFRIMVDFNYGILIPNVFTPDNNGSNDVWYIPNSGMKEFHVEIYDRWGLKVWETSADEIRWDGRSLSGKLLNDGTYYFALTAILKSGSGVKNYSTKGHISLLTKEKK